MCLFEEIVDKHKFNKKDKSARSKLPLSPTANYAKHFLCCQSVYPKSECALNLSHTMTLSLSLLSVSLYFLFLSLVHQVFDPGQEEKKVCHCHRFGCPDLTERTYVRAGWSLPWVIIVKE